jgi:tetratricopeptide (TPR) repeat protein
MTVDHRQRAADLIALRKFDQAVQAARHALRQHPDDAEAQRFLAWALWGQNELSRAELAARAALRLAPDGPDAHSILALVLASRGKYQEARQHHERAVALAPNVPAFHVRYGALLLNTDRWAAALRQANVALKLDPRDVDALLVRAMALRAQGHLPEAEAAVREALARAPNHALAHHALGLIHLNRDEGDEAFACFREALRLNPNDERLKRQLVRAVEARLPLIGAMWRYGQSSLSRRLLWTAVNLFSFVWCCATAWTNPVLGLIFGVFQIFNLVWGLFVWVVDPAITHAVMKGWIK